jgi:tripartite-type tricarboxylate transporter receptor subunit TctC
VFTRRAFSISAAAAILARGDDARAQGTFATQNIRLVVGYPAGGGVDIVARLLTDPMKAAFGQTVLVENKPGAAACLLKTSPARRR